MSKDLVASPAHNNSPVRRLVRSRPFLYAVVVCLGVLALAYFDGGEEPIRPIVQPVDLSGPFDSSSIAAESE